MWHGEVPDGAEPVGYLFLVEHFKIQALPHYRWSFVMPKSNAKQVIFSQSELHLYPRSYQIESDVFKHLEFALKREGLNLLILKEVLSKLTPKDITQFVLQAPTGKYSRKIWFLYEFLLNKRLPIEDIKRGSYLSIADPDQYYSAPPIKSPRHRILNNLLGNRDFCPLVRRSKRLLSFDNLKVQEGITRLTQQFDSNVLTRAMRYLYTKETMASWEIEREKPSRARLTRFIALLERGDTTIELSKRTLIGLQKEIVDPRFALDDYRSFQNYIGEEPAPGELIVHFIPPKPDDLAFLMENLLRCTNKMIRDKIHPVITAAIFTFGFVFLHPFWDGNGRLHRFLIHQIFSRLDFAPKGFIFPISAVILRERLAYDQALESFSKPLSELITEYELNESGEITVHQATLNFYQFIDFTIIAEFLFQCVNQTVHTDFEEELKFLSQYDHIKKMLKQIVDMPDQSIDLFIKCVRQNEGTLSERKRKSHFEMLTEDEIQRMEDVMRQSSAST